MYWGYVFLEVFDGGNNNVWIDEVVLLVYFSLFYFSLWNLENREYRDSCSAIVSYEKSIYENIYNIMKLYVYVI